MLSIRTYEVCCIRRGPKLALKVSSASLGRMMTQFVELVNKEVHVDHAERKLHVGDAFGKHEAFESGKKS